MKQKVIDMKKESKIDAWEKLKAFVKTDEFNSRGVNGLCLAILRMYYGYKTITKSQLDYIQLVIDKDDRNYISEWGSYHWRPGLKAPRIKWINKKLRELE